MIELFTWTTRAGLCPIILLEELALPYRLVPVNVATGAHRIGYRVVNPHETIPALVDPEGPEGTSLTVCEWGTIAIYLAEKTGRLLPAHGAARYSALEWFTFQIASVAPTIAQADHFVNAEHEHRYAEERFGGEAARIYQALDARLGSVDYLAGDYSVADIGTFPWVRDPDLVDLELATYPNVARWIDRLERRAPVRKALAVARPGVAEG